MQTPWHDSCSSQNNPEGCCLPTHSRPTCGGTPDLQIRDCLKVHQITHVRGWFPPTLHISVGSRLAYMTSYALIHNCIGCETSSNCVVTVFYMTFYTAVLAKLFFLLWLKSKKKKKKAWFLENIKPSFLWKTSSLLQNIINSSACGVAHQSWYSSWCIVQMRLWDGFCINKNC